jgi:hypothetical protein
MSDTSFTPIIPTPEETNYVKARLQEFSLIERLAHSDTGAYGAPDRDDGVVYSIPAQNTGRPTLYEVIKLNTSSMALVGEILVPMDPKESQKIFINWTGTHSVCTALADFEKTPGEESYRREEKRILQQINDVIKNYYKKTNLKANIVVTGHSLGGSIAQNTWNSIQRMIARHFYEDGLSNKPAYKSFYHAIYLDIDTNENQGCLKLSCDQLSEHYIESLTLGIWNSSGVLKAVEKNSHQLAQIVYYSGVKQRALFGMVEGDPIQTIGEGTILSNVDSDFVEISLLKINSSYKDHICKSSSILGSTVVAAAGCLLSTPMTTACGLTMGMLLSAKKAMDAHTANHFVNKESPLNHHNTKLYQLYENTSPEASKIIEENLKHKFSGFQWSSSQVMRKSFHFMFGRCVKQSQNPESESFALIRRLNIV